MSVDAYTRFLLTVIALALVTIAWRLGPSPIPEAVAGETMDCRFSNALEVSRFSDDLTVELKQGFSQPGTSSSSPVYVKMVE